MDFQHTARSLSGRWHRGIDYPAAERFPALYTSNWGHVSEAEFLRHYEDQRRRTRQPLDLREDPFRVSELEVKLSLVYDFRDADFLGLPIADLYHDSDYTTPKRLAAAAYRRGAEGILVWSAAVDVEPRGAAWNLIIFPDNVRSGSLIRPTGVWTSIRWFGAPSTT